MCPFRVKEDSALSDARLPDCGQVWLAGFRPARHREPVLAQARRAGVTFLSLIVLIDEEVLNETIIAKVSESCMIIR